jgi:hypothetical protein
MEKWVLVKLRAGSLLEFRVCDTCHCIVDSTARPPRVTHLGNVQELEKLDPCRCPRIGMTLIDSV